MSWFSRQFERKAGGSALGNMWRRVVTTVASEVTFGLSSATFDTDNNGMLDFLEQRKGVK